MRKIIPLLLALVMLLGCLAGCGSGAESDMPSASGDPAPTQAPAPATEPENQPPESDPSVNESEPPEGNQYEKVNYELPLFEETPEFSVFYPIRNGNQSAMPSRNSEDFPFWVRVQENLNVELEFEEPNEVSCAEQYNLMMVSEDYTDLIFEGMVNSAGSAYSGGYDLAIEDGIYVNLMDYMDYAPNYAHYVLDNPDNRRVVVTEEGNVGAFLKVLSEQQNAVMGLCVHKDYLDATGLPMPETVPEWMEMFAAMAAQGVKYPCDSNNKGQIQGGDFEEAMGACVNPEFLIDAKSGDMVFGPTTAETKEYIELFIECMDNGWIEPDWLTFSGRENPLFADGSIATCDQIYPQLPNLPQRLGFELTPCPVPHRDGYGAGQLAIGELSYPLASAGGGIAITTSCGDLENAMKMIDWMYSDEGAEIINFGWVEGETYEVIDGEKVITPFYSANDENFGCGNKSLYTNDRDFGYTYPNVALAIAQEIQITASNGWTVDTSNEAAIYLRLPDAVQLSSEKSSELNLLISDLSTYIETTLLGWMNRTVEFSDAEWETFCNNCEGMNLTEIQAGYEAAYERYSSK